MRIIQFLCKQSGRIVLLSICTLLFVFGLSTRGLAQQPDGGVVWDPAMRVPSLEGWSAWFPDLAVDQAGRVHIVWDATIHNWALIPDEQIEKLLSFQPEARRFKASGVSGRSELESLHYSVWDGQQWSRPVDLVPPSSSVNRSSIAIDGNDVIHLLVRGPHPGGEIMYYTQAKASVGLSARVWESLRRMSHGTRTYMNDIAAYQNTIHVVYDDSGAETGGECSSCSDIFYRRSTDGGQTWSAPVAPWPTDNIGSTRAQLEIDKTGVVYLAWDEGWDRLIDIIARQQQGVYTYSLDGGKTWKPPVIVAYPASTNAQLSVGADGRGGVMLVWRTRSPEYPGIYTMWSTDYGASWSPPGTLPGVVAREWNTNYDRYDMATDSAGHIHLLVTGKLSTESKTQGPPALYHFEWDGTKWSSPLTVYEGNWYPEYPHLVTHGGNQLHATWFIREDPSKVTTPFQVWYAHGQSSAPAEAPVPVPTSTPTATPEATSTPTATPAPTRIPTPTPTLDPRLVRVSIPPGTTDSIYTDTDELMLLAKSLIPAILVVVVVVIGVRAWRRR